MQGQTKILKLAKMLLEPGNDRHKSQIMLQQSDLRGVGWKWEGICTHVAQRPFRAWQRSIDAHEVALRSSDL